MKNSYKIKSTYSLVSESDNRLIRYFTTDKGNGTYSVQVWNERNLNYNHPMPIKVLDRLEISLSDYNKEYAHHRDGKPTFEEFFLNKLQKHRNKLHLESDKTDS